MEPGTQASFIPQDAAAPTATLKIRASGGLSDLLILIAIVMFVASLALAGAVFLYEEYLKTSAASKIEQLQRAKEAFEPSLIQELTRLDDRMQVAEQVLGAHIAPTAFFQTLEQATLATIAFESLDMQAADQQRISVKMSGVAESVNSIALQADLFSKNGVITSPIFSDINRQADGVHFNLTALINPRSINYVRLIQDVSQQLQTQLPQVQNPQQTAPVEQSPFAPAPGADAPTGNPEQPALPSANQTQ